MDIKCFLIVDTGKTVTEQTEYGTSTKSIYKRTDTGEEMFIRDAPVGAIWRAEWYEDCKEFCGPDGKSYVVKTPGGDWCIDGRATNCTLPNDAVHKCWVRHGEAPNLTVDKKGNTCTAGAGSIMIGSYHGFLKNGYLTNC